MSEDEILKNFEVSRHPLFKYNTMQPLYKKKQTRGGHWRSPTLRRNEGPDRSLSVEGRCAERNKVLVDDVFDYYD